MESLKWDIYFPSEVTERLRSTDNNALLFLKDVIHRISDTSSPGYARIGLEAEQLW